MSVAHLFQDCGAAKSATCDLPISPGHFFAPPSMHFRLLSFNIHKGIGGVDRRYDLRRTVDTINSYQPDIVFLQEVDEEVPRSRHHRQAELLADAIRLPHMAFQRNVRLRVGHYGNAVLSRFPLHEAIEIDLTLRPKKRRGALVTRCSIPVGEHTKTITLTNLHLGLSGIERQIQLRRLLAKECLHVLRRRTPLVIGGDYNDVWGSLGWRIMHRAGFQDASGKIRTFPAAMPMRSLDRIFYRGDLKPIRAFAGHTEIARRASDHLPLIVEFEFTRK
jgi:endonuclease/exonuclease/phosphatase family metal-dependent hydrolase